MVRTKKVQETDTVKVAPKPQAAPKQSTVVAHGVGRRKSSVARVWLKRGKGNVLVNGKKVEMYFSTDVSRSAAVYTISVLPEFFKRFDVDVYVEGGGVYSQADAMKLGISRAVVQFDNDARGLLRQHGLLTVDSRVKERKKYGRKAARRRFQFVKR
jgi:small subunit ribosomal protein S9